MRVEGWEALLAAHIMEAYARPFAWGSHDCALWSADWVAKCTGTDYGTEWRDRYSDEKGARSLMRRRKLKTVAAIADKHLPEKPVTLARRGDLVLHPDGALGICHGARSHFLTDAGVLAIPTLSCPKAWGVD